MTRVATPSSWLRPKWTAALTPSPASCARSTRYIAARTTRHNRGYQEASSRPPSSLAKPPTSIARACGTARPHTFAEANGQCLTRRGFTRGPRWPVAAVTMASEINREAPLGSRTNCSTIACFSGNWSGRTAAWRRLPSPRRAPWRLRARLPGKPRAGSSMRLRMSRRPGGTPARPGCSVVTRPDVAQVVFPREQAVIDLDGISAWGGRS